MNTYLVKCIVCNSQTKIKQERTIESNGRTKEEIRKRLKGAGIEVLEIKKVSSTSKSEIEFSKKDTVKTNKNFGKIYAYKSPFK